MNIILRNNIMRVLTLANFKIQPAVAELYKSNDDKYYFNLRHGIVGYSFWRWSVGLDINYFRPTKELTEYVLDGNDYFLDPIKKNGVTSTDSIGNSLYTITKDKMTIHKNDILLLWEIPNKYFTNVSYETSGMCTVIGEGSVGRLRGDTVFKSPCPVIEILGDCILSWTGKDIEGKIYSQIIKYDYAEKKWDVSPIEIG